MNFEGVGDDEFQGLDEFVVMANQQEDTSMLRGDSSVASGNNSREVASKLSIAAKLLQHAHHAMSSSRSNGSGGNGFGLNDITQANPLESEAETTILRALEERDPTLTPRIGHARDHSLLSNVPDDVSHTFDEDPSVTSRERQSQQDANTNSSGRTRPQPQIPAPRPRQDVEQQLFGLTTALRAIHADNNFDNVGSQLHDVVGGPPLLVDDLGPLSAADELAQNAGLLFRRNIRSHSGDQEQGGSVGQPANTNEASGAISATSTRARSKWGKVRGAVLLNPKKTYNEAIAEEADEDEEADPEVGRVASTASGGTQSMAPDHPHPYRPFVGYFHRPDVRKAVSNAAKRTSTEISNDLNIFRAFFHPRKSTVYTYCKSVLFYFIIPALLIAAILFYFVDNPHTGKQSHRTDTKKQKNGSISWWIIFLCVRQVVTLTSALALQVLVVDFFALRTRLTLRLCGPVVTLLIVQSKGWPFTLFAWGLIDLFMLAGPGPFARHWLYFQPWVGLFNADNPSGNFISSKTNYRIIAVAVCVSFVVAVKRVMIGLYLGRRTFANYSRQLTQVMHSMFLISEVATLAKSLEAKSTQETTRLNTTTSNAEAVFGWRDRFMSEDDPSENAEQRGESDAPAMEGPSAYDSSRFSASQRSLLRQALEDWEEPERGLVLPATISVGAILQFRQALAFMSNNFPFSVSFGLADSRDACIQSSALLYDSLVINSTSDEVLKFETISVLTKDGECIDHHKLKDLIRLFRPNREGRLTKIDFIKSVDNVYKSMRFLRASVAAAAKIDTAFESIFNVGFYVVTTCIALSILGFNPLTLFLSLSGVIVSFAFMIGSAAAKYFEGVLFILVRRPFDIGDRIHVSDVNKDTDGNGSACWIVDDVDLFTTTVIYGSTNERATMSNGSLAASRIINANRSPKAVIYIYLKFGVDVPYEKVKIFQTVIEQFVKARPREWLALVCFRASNVELAQGFIEYVVSAQHRETWQNIGSILNSKADLASFCLEVMKKMDMGYVSPSLPVALTVKGADEMVQRLGAERADVAKVDSVKSDSGTQSNVDRSEEESFSMISSIAKMFPHR